MREACPNLARAVALAYDQGRSAPRVVAKGDGLIAEEIMRRAREAGVAVHESRELVGMLMQVDLDSEIPPLLYTAVAEVLAWVYGMERSAARSGPAASPGAAPVAHTRNTP